MSPNSRKPILVLYLVCCAAVTTILSFRGGARNSQTVLLEQTKPREDYRYHFRFPLQDANSQNYLSSCVKGTFGVCLKAEDKIVASKHSPLVSLGTLEKKYFFDPYDNREDFYKVPFLEESYLIDLLPYCDYKPSYARPHKVVKFEGVMEVEMVYVYPCDCSLQEKILRYDPLTGNLCLSKKEADNLIQLFMSKLESRYPGTFKLLKVVNIEVKFDYMKGQRVLLELLFQKGSDPRAYRVSHYYFVNWENDVMCDISNHQWSRDAHVYFLVITKDLGTWVQHFIRNMEDIQKLTGDENFSVIVVDFNSTDLDVKKTVEESRLQHPHTIVLSNSTFHKTLAQNEGFSYVTDKNSIIFTIDLHLDIPPNIVENIRKHTIQGMSGYAPVLLRLKNGSFPRTQLSEGRKWNNLGRWELWGYGLFSLYKSDWTAIGNMNLEFGQQWGGEDYDLVDRLLRKGYEVNRLLHMKLFHYYHTHKGMWGKDSKYITDGIVEEENEDTSKTNKESSDSTMESSDTTASTKKESSVTRRTDSHQ